MSGARPQVFGLDVKVVTESNVSYTPEYWGHWAAKKIMPSLISVAETATPAIRGQADAFRSRIYDLIVLEVADTVKRALEAESRK